MRFPIAYYLVLLYCTVMLKPLIPLLSDAWSHTFSETFHIMTVHAKYGKNHLSKELASNTTDSKNQNTLTSEEQVQVHIISSESKFDFSFEKLATSYTLYKPPVVTPIFIFKEGPPPKV